MYTKAFKSMLLTIVAFRVIMFSMYLLRHRYVIDIQPINFKPKLPNSSCGFTVAMMKD